MLTALDDRPVLHHEDLVRGEDRGEPVGDQDARAVLHERLDRLLNLLLRDRVERRCRLVKDEQGRIFEEHPRDRDPLLLPTRELESAVSDHRVEPALLLLDEIVDICLLQGLDHLLLGRVVLRIEQVLPDCPVEEIGLLAHDADLLPEPREIELPDVDPVKGDTAARHVVETRDQVDHRALAGARGTDDRDAFPAVKLEADVL